MVMVYCLANTDCDYATKRAIKQQYKFIGNERTSGAQQHTTSQHACDNQQHATMHEQHNKNCTTEKTPNSTFYCEAEVVSAIPNNISFQL